jgi:hypothetical protein
MNEILKKASGGLLFYFGIPSLLIVAWMLLFGWFFSSITQPGAIDRSIAKVLARPSVEPEPSMEAVASAALSRGADRCDCASQRAR